MFSQSEPPQAPSGRDGGGSRRSFRVEGRLGGLRYDFGARISELMPKGTDARERALGTRAQAARIGASPVEVDACRDPIDVWESEGGH